MVDVMVKRYAERITEPGGRDKSFKVGSPALIQILLFRTPRLAKQGSYHYY